MKKILLYTLPTGQGHNQAARAVKEFLESDKIANYEVKIINPLNESSPIVQRIIKNGYVFAAEKTPFIYGNLYKFANQNFPGNSIFKLSRSKLFSSILSDIAEEKPDLVISTHPLLNKNLSDVKDYFTFNLISVITDYKAHRAYLADNIDAYLTGSDYTRKDLIKAGVAEDKVFAYGIPVSSEFLKKRNTEKDRTKNGSRLQVLIMGGSLGLGLKEKDIIKIIKKLDMVDFYVVCGNNKKLYQGLKDQLDLHLNPNATLYGYSDKIPDLMDCSDLIISKPGGITLTEALLKNLPMIMPYAIPGQEEENSNYVTKNNFGKRVSSTKEIIAYLTQINENKDDLESMKESIKAFSGKYSMEKNKSIILTYLNNTKRKQRNQKDKISNSVACG